MLLSETAFDPTFSLVPWVVFIPVIGLVVNLLVGKRLGERGAGIVASLAAAGSFTISVILAVALGQHPEGGVVPFLNWFTIGEFSVDWAFRVDTLSATMMLVVSGVGTLIHIYAIGYMHSDVRHNGDPGRYTRFFVYLNLFIAMMMILVSADNYLMLFVGWEGVGLCSYLLIGFWFEKGANGIANAKAAKKAFIANRIGDFGLLIAIFLMVGAFGTLDFDSVFAAAGAAAPAIILAITLFMLLGVTGKSAQIPLYVWLPDAMAGPTPVSALIHAATMVTAGVYLVARSNALFALAPAAQQTTAWIGVLTAFFAATIAIGQNDIKKVLAYSTISQLGFMVAAVGMGAYVAGMFHLVTHAFFKALLFLGAGSVILGMEKGAAARHGHADHGGHGEEPDPQDMRNMGGLREKMPLTFWVYLVGALALAGVAPLAGFFSKDEILTAASKNSPLFLGLLLAAAFMTAFYVGRQLWLVFFGKPRSEAAENAGESPAVVTIPLMILAALSAFGGLLNLPGSHWLETWLEHTFGHGEAGEFVWAVAGSSLGLAVIGLFLAWVVYSRRNVMAKAEDTDPLAGKLGPLFRGTQSKWWIDELYHALVIGPYEKICGWFAGPVDLGVIDWLGNGLGRFTRWTAELWSRTENGYVRSYALAILVGVVTIVTYLVIR